MKKSILATVATAALLTIPSFAGETTYTATGKTQVVPQPPVYGTGFYLGVQAGINAAQDWGGSKDFNIGGNDLSLEAQDDIGFVGGLKAGYVFGTGTIRPAIEADLYYNGLGADIDATLNGNDLDVDTNGDLHTGAFMANFMVRFAFDRFQPYLGGGVGGYYAESKDVNVKIAGQSFDADDTNDSGFAWQLVGGADYYFTEKFSAFAEYKFLNYEDAGADDDRLSQHLVVVGLRVHF